MKRKFFIALLSCIAYKSLHAQSTAGAGELVAIESKSASYKEYERKIAQLTGEFGGNQNSKIQLMQGDLESMRKKRDAEIIEMKGGYRCGHCKLLKSEIEKKGENFDEHLKRTNSTRSMPSDEEIGSKRQDWNERIAILIVQISDFNNEDGGSGANPQNEEIAKLRQYMAKICPEITGLSKLYEEKVIAEAKNLQPSWIDDAMGAAASKHIIEDKIFIATAKIRSMEKELGESEQEQRGRIKKENDDKINALKENIRLLEQKIKNPNQEVGRKLGELDEKLVVKKEALQKVEKSITPSINDSLLKVLAKQTSGIKSEIASLERQKQALQKSSADLVTEWNASVKKSNDEIEALTLNFNRFADQEIQKFRKSNEDRIAQLKLNKADYERQLSAAHAKFLTQADESRKKLAAFLGLVEKEKNRIVIATAPIKCIVPVTVDATVTQNFNMAAECMEGFRSRDRSFPAASMDCAAQSKSYMSVYKSFISGLGTEDIQAIKAGTGSYWYNSIFK